MYLHYLGQFSWKFERQSPSTKFRFQIQLIHHNPQPSQSQSTKVRATTSVRVGHVLTGQRSRPTVLCTVQHSRSLGSGLPHPGLGQIINSDQSNLSTALSNFSHWPCSMEFNGTDEWADCRGAPALSTACCADPDPTAQARNSILWYNFVWTLCPLQM